MLLLLLLSSSGIVILVISLGRLAPAVDVTSRSCSGDPVSNLWRLDLLFLARVSVASESVSMKLVKGKESSESFSFESECARLLDRLLSAFGSAVTIFPRCVKEDGASSGVSEESPC
jgi:hypothetical protein